MSILALIGAVAIVAIVISVLNGGKSSSSQPSQPARDYYAVEGIQLSDSGRNYLLLKDPSGEPQIRPMLQDVPPRRRKQNEFGLITVTDDKGGDAIAAVRLLLRDTFEEFEPAKLYFEEACKTRGSMIYPPDGNGIAAVQLFLIKVSAADQDSVRKIWHEKDTPVILTGPLYLIPENAGMDSKVSLAS